MGTPEQDDGTQYPDSEYISERQRIAERFIALGGGSTIDLDLAKMPRLADLITPQHRAMVKDLAAAGLSNEAVARIMGISKERLQSLFEFEVGTGYEIAHATMARALYLKGVAGDTVAQTNWLRLHNKSNWGSKTEMLAKVDATVTITEQQKEAKDWLDAVFTEIEHDPQIKSKALPAPAAKAKELTSAPKVSHTTSKVIRKPKAD